MSRNIGLCPADIAAELLLLDAAAAAGITPAAASRLGGIIPGANVTVAPDGTLSVIDVSGTTSKATNGFVPRSLASRAGDALNVLDQGAAIDGTTDDTAALGRAQAAAGTRPVTIPYGTMKVTAAIADITGLFKGPGQLLTGEGTKRAPGFSHLTAAPASLGVDFDHTFSGDISKVQIALEHRISGATTLGQPASAYSMHGEHSAVLVQFLNESGYAGNPNDQTGGRTGAAAVTIAAGSTGQGDTYCLNLSGFITGTNPGSTNFLANPSYVALVGGCFSFAHGTYQQFDEFSHDDGGFGAKGFDIAVSSTVRNFSRSNNDGAKGTWWVGTRYQTGAGSLPVDAGFQLVGKFNTALDTSSMIGGTAKAVWLQAAGSRIYLNSTPFADGFANPAKTVPGTEYTHFNPTTQAYEVVVGGAPVLSAKAGGVTLSAPLPVASGGTGLATPPGSYYVNNALISGTANTLPRLDVYTTAAGTFTWTKLANAALVDITLIGAGGGGGAGGVFAASTAASGGGGGGAGARVFASVPAVLIGPTVTGTAGTGGGGAPGGASTSAGISGGNASGATTFGVLSAYGGTGGTGGNVSTATGGLGGGANGQGGGVYMGGASNTGPTAAGGGSGGANGLAGSGGGSGKNGDLGGPASGAAGAGLSAGGAAFAGSAGGVVPGTAAVLAAAIGANGPAANPPPFGFGVGASGGSGGSSVSASAGNAGAGSGYGAGGSGGGSCVTGGTAGNGAAGMPGLVMVLQR